MFQMNSFAKLFWNTCINIEIMAQTRSMYDHFIIWHSSVTLTFTQPEQMFQMALLLLKENNSVKPFLKSMHKCRSYGPDKLSYAILSFDLHLWPWPSTYLNKSFKWHLYSSRTPTVPNISKSMRKWSHFGLDKHILWPFYHFVGWTQYCGNSVFGNFTGEAKNVPILLHFVICNWNLQNYDI